MKIIPVIYPWQEIWVGMQLICGREKCVLIDTGIDDAAKSAIVPAMEKNGISPDSLALVINTHHHGDHTLCNQAVREYCNARFAIHRDGADGMYSEQQFTADVLLEDGMRIQEDDIGLEIIHTPGHSPDAICVLESSTGSLFSGDSIQGSGIEALGLALLGNIGDYRNSMKKLLALYRQGRFSRIYPGHQFRPADGGILRDGEIETFLQASLDTAEQYMQFAGEMKFSNSEDFFQGLLSKFNQKPSPVWENTARNMAKALFSGSKTDSEER